MASVGTPMSMECIFSLLEMQRSSSSHAEAIAQLSNVLLDMSDIRPKGVRLAKGRYGSTVSNFINPNQMPARVELKYKRRHRRQTHVDLPFAVHYKWVNKDLKQEMDDWCTECFGATGSRTWAIGMGSFLFHKKHQASMFMLMFKGRDIEA